MDDKNIIPADGSYPVKVTNIKENKSQTFNIENSDVTFNVTQTDAAPIPTDENGIPYVPLTPTRYDSKTRIIYLGTEEIKLPIQLTLQSTNSKQIPRYVDALCEVYSEKIKAIVTPDLIDTLPPSLRHNFSEQRKAYYSAESVHHSVREIFADGEEQFQALKIDAYDGISDTYFDDRHASGYDRLLAVLDKVTNITLSKSTFSNILGLIANLEKKGICHILMNDGTIKSWVNIDE